MVETVTDAEYYHVMHSKSYVRRAPLQLGQSFSVGTTTNPFMGYYNKARTYSVNAGGKTIDVPALKFLRDVRKGRIECPDIAKQAYNVANHYSMLARELIMEDVRRDIAPTAPSRKSCLWVVDELGLAAYWQKKIGGASRLVKLRLTGTLHKGDAKFLLNESEPLADTYDKARRYWLGEQTTSALPEYLFSGTAIFTEDNLEVP